MVVVGVGEAGGCEQPAWGVASEGGSVDRAVDGLAGADHDPWTAFLEYGGMLLVVTSLVSAVTAMGSVAGEGGGGQGVFTPRLCSVFGG